MAQQTPRTISNAKAQANHRYAIYILWCPLSKQIKYAGMTSIRPSERLSLHIGEAKKEVNAKNSRKNMWLRTLIDAGLEPSMRIITGVDTREDARDIEETLLCYLDHCREMVNTYPFHKANRAA